MSSLENTANPQSLNLPRPVSVSLNKPSTVQCIARQSRPPVRILVAVNGQLIADESKYSTEILQKPIPNPYAEPTVAAQPLVISSPANIRLADMQKSFYDTITNVTLSDVTMAMHNYSVECFVFSFMTREVGLEDYHQSTSSRLQLPDVVSLRKNSMNTKSWLQVNYAPEVRLNVISADKVLKEEDVISLECSTKAIPAIHSYKWFIGDNLLPGVLGSSLNLKLRKEMHLKTVTCEATNSVAAVKASLKLNILFKPAFVKGAQSFMLIERGSCNKPLTLDCHVAANPSANVTWYRRRRRLSHSLYKYVTPVDSSRDSSGHNRLDYSKLKSLNINDDYFDELIGTGPTYTVASFNCANKLANQTRRFNGSKKKAAGVIKKRSAVLADSELTTEKGGDASAYDEDYAYDDDYMDYEGQAHVLADNINFDFSHRAERAKQPSEHELDDFGVYVCEASNMFALEHGHEKRVSKRYIKINPVGPPILRILPQQTSQQQPSERDLSTVMVPEGEVAAVGEAATSLGDSVALTCLIEPLPTVQTIVWINEHGKILPNSKYSVFESVQGSDFGFDTTEDNDSKKQPRNLSVQYENLTEQGSSEARAAKTDAGVMKSVLYIKNVRPQDLGVYRCVASNGEGSSASAVLLRQATFLDRIDMNDSLVFTATLSAILAICVLLLLTCLCVVSRRAREACCCYCCLLGGYSLGHRRHNEKELLSHNSNCTEQHSDKTINDWLASSKLSNDTTGSSLINVAAPGNNSSTITAASLLKGLGHEQGGCLGNLHNTLSKASRGQSTTAARCHILSTPLQLRRDLANGNCSSLLNSDDLDLDEPTSSNEALSNRRHHLGLLNNPLEFNTFNGANGKRDELKLGSDAATANATTNYYSSFNRFMVSSPLLSNASSSPKDSDHCGSHPVSPADPKPSNPEVLLNSVGTAAIAKTLHMPPMMTIRSQNISNGNFNAKITAGTFANPMDANSAARPQFNTFTLSRNLNEAPQTSTKFSESPLYDNPKGSATDLSKLLQDNNFRFADLFNELSPNLAATSANGQNPNGTLPKNPSLYANRAFQSTLPKNPNAMSLFQQFPSISSSPKHSPTSQQPSSQLQNSRQNLLQPTISTATQLQMNSSFNKFPNTFATAETAAEAKSSSTSKFYNNFYRNPSLRTDSDNCK